MPDAAPAVVEDFVCTGCGLLCDDLRLKLRGERIVSVTPACLWAEKRLLADVQPEAPPAAMITGRAATFAAALERAAELLGAAQAPLVLGFEEATIDAQRAAVEMADRLGALLEPTDRTGRSGSGWKLEVVGGAGATLGQIAASDLVIAWGIAAAATPPRLFERLRRQRPLALAEDGAGGEPTNTVGQLAQADALLVPPLPDGLAGASMLQALLDERPLDESRGGDVAGVRLDRWRHIAERIRSARYVAFVVGASTPPRQREQLVALVQARHRQARGAVLKLVGPGNVVGASQVLAWQTGLGGSIDFSRGGPRYRPGELELATLLDGRQIDAVVAIAADPLPHLPAALADRWRAIPQIVIDDAATATFATATVSLGVATLATQSHGDLFRCDGVALPLRAALPSPLPDAASVLQDLLLRVSPRETTA